jgi:hypothetical protein
MNITEFFDKQLDSPLANALWSWGAKSRDGKRIALRVWAHDGRKRDGKYWMSVDYADWGNSAPGYVSSGIAERQRHVAEMRSGVPAIGVVCEAIDGDTSKGIKSFDDRQVLVFTSEFMETHGEVFVRYVEKRKL